MSRLKEVRTTALIAGITALLTLPLPVWNATRSIMAVAAQRDVTAWFIPALILAYLFTAILPVFFFALYRNAGALCVPKGARLFGLVAAVVFAVLMAPTLPDVIPNVPILLGELSNLAYLLLLLALVRRRDDEAPQDVPVSRHLRLVSKVASIAYGIWGGFCLATLAVAPFAHMQLENWARHAGASQTPGVGAMMMKQTGLALNQACLFAAPYIVYKSLPRLRSPENLGL